MRDVEDAATDRKWEKALKANLRALARGVFDFQSSVANRAASGRKGRGENDGASSKRPMRGEQFSSERTARSGVNLLEEERIGIAGKSRAGERDHPGCTAG